MTAAQPLDLVSLRRAAELLGVHYMTAYRYVRMGLLPAFKAGTAWQVRLADIETFRSGAAVGEGHQSAAPYDQRLEARFLAGDLPGSWRVVEAALTSGMEPATFYEEVLAPALRLIGDKWAAGTLGVGDEHRASGVAQRVVGRLSHQMVRRGQSKGTIVVGTSQVESHGLPVAMLADLLRAAGYDVVDLGCNLPVESFASAVGGADRLAAVAVSVTTRDHDGATAETISAVKQAAAAAPVVVGGSGIVDAAHAMRLGADHHATTARELIALVG